MPTRIEFDSVTFNFILYKKRRPKRNRIRPGQTELKGQMEFYVDGPNFMGGKGEAKHVNVIESLEKKRRLDRLGGKGKTAITFFVGHKSGLNAIKNNIR